MFHQEEGKLYLPVADSGNCHTSPDIYINKDCGKSVKSAMTIDCAQKVATKSRKNDVNLKEKDIELLLLFKKTLENLS
jgi:hypothetical protein